VLEELHVTSPTAVVLKVVELPKHKFVSPVIAGVAGKGGSVMVILPFPPHPSITGLIKV